MQIVSNDELLNITGGSHVYAYAIFRVIEVSLHFLSKWFR